MSANVVALLVLLGLAAAAVVFTLVFVVVVDRSVENRSGRRERSEEEGRAPGPQ